MKKLLLALFLTITQVSASETRELTLYFVPSPHGVDWSSPRALMKSAIKNKMSLTSRFLGHVFVELKCQDQSELITMDGKSFDYINQLLIEQKGLGIFYHSFEGTLQDKASSESELAEYLKNGRASFARFLLNGAQCKRAAQYLREYRELNVGRHFGLVHRPRYAEGGSSEAFAASFLDVLDILDQDMKESWSQAVNVPLKLMGPPVTNEGVSFFKALFTDSWAKDSGPHRKVTFWSADKMNQWVKNKISLKQAHYSIFKLENAEGIVFDKTHFPAPLGPIWLQHLDQKIKKSSNQ